MIGIEAAGTPFDAKSGVLRPPAGAVAFSAIHGESMKVSIPQPNPAACRNCTATTFCGEHYTPEIEEAGWNEVAERMDRWGKNGYAGHWQDGRYDVRATATSPNPSGGDAR